MRKPLLLYALVAAVLFVACSPEEQPAETDKTPSTDTSDVEIAFPEGASSAAPMLPGFIRILSATLSWLKRYMNHARSTCSKS